MNFKLRSYKIIVSVAVGILYLLYTQFFIIHCSDLPNRPCNYIIWFDVIKSLITIFLIYIIWSLFEKKKG